MRAPRISVSRSDALHSCLWAENLVHIDKVHRHAADGLELNSLYGPVPPGPGPSLYPPVVTPESIEMAKVLDPGEEVESLSHRCKQTA